MELIQYWKIVRRRWWLPAILILLVGIISLLTYQAPPQMYTTSFKFNVGLAPVPRPGSSYEDNPLDTWMASEYFGDDLALAVRGADYARRVAQRLGEDGVNLSGMIGSATEHRVLTVSIIWPRQDQLARIANAAVAVLEQEAAELVGPLGESRPVLPLIDPPVVVPVGRSLKEKLDLPIRLGLALVTGIAGTFLLDYLDTSIRDRDQVERMGISVLAEIPGHR
jgi:capsular polysaccharide biosynthesis protein